MELTQAENLAINILRPHMEIFQTVLTPDGQNININSVYDFYEKLARQLSLARARRKGDFIEIEAQIQETSSNSI